MKHVVWSAGWSSCAVPERFGQGRIRIIKSRAHADWWIMACHVPFCCFNIKPCFVLFWINCYWIYRVKALYFANMLLMRLVAHKTRKKNMLNKSLQYWWIEFRRGGLMQSSARSFIWHWVLANVNNMESFSTNSKGNTKENGEIVDIFHMYCFVLGAGSDKKDHNQCSLLWNWAWLIG